MTGSFETNTNVYLKDAKTLATVPDGRFGSNNYLKVDYYNRRFSAGVQLEAYAPAAVGYPGILEKAALTNYYVAWTDKDFSVTAGTFYEQFGSGLLFRSWEDRALGLNNSIMGARVAYHFRDIVSVKALWGMPRFGMKFSDTQVKGADASFAISNLVGWQRVYLAVEGSVLDRYEKLSAAQEADKGAARAPRKDMYKFILEDLAAAESLLSQASAAGMPQSVTRPSLSGVYGLYARAYIEMAYWEDNPEPKTMEYVVKYADKVISDFEPLNAAQWHDPSSGFNRASSNSSWVWGLSLDSSMTNNLFNFTAMMSSEAQYSYAQFTQPGISALLYSHIPDADFRKSSWYVSGSGLDYKYAGTLEDAEQTKLYATDYMSLKFRPAQGNCTDYSVGVAADHPLMRVEEMYFLKMEALAGTDVTAAVSLLESFMNTYRYTDGSYTCAAADFAQFIDEMMIQKRIEFWGEGILIYDYKRLNLGITRNYKGTVLTNFTSDYLLNTTGRSPQWNFCIPLSEIQTNQGITSDQNNPDPTSFTGDPQRTL